MSKPTFIKGLIAFAILFYWQSQAIAQNVPIRWEASLQAYIDTALKNNPSLHSYHFQNNALQLKIKASAALDDPMLYAGIMNLPLNFSFTGDMMTMKQIGIQQNFSVGKKYSLKSAVAQKEYESGSYNFLAQRLITVKLVKQQYFDLYAIERKIVTMQNGIEAMKSYFNIANSRYSIGQGTQQDVFKAQVELTKMQQELIKMESMREDMIAIFNTLLYRGKSDSVEVPSQIKFQLIDLAMDSLMNEAFTNNPMLLSMKTMVGKDSASYQLAKASKIPDFNANLWYGQRQALNPDGSKAKDMLGLTIGITLPVYSKQKQNPLISESVVNIQKSKSQVEAAQNEIALMIHHALIDAAKNEKLIALYEKQLIPQATANLNAGITGYQQNKIDFMTFSDNFISLYNFRLEYEQAIADYMKAIADLEMLTGRNLIIQP